MGFHMGRTSLQRVLVLVAALVILLLLMFEFSTDDEVDIIQNKITLDHVMLEEIERQRMQQSRLPSLQPIPPEVGNQMNIYTIPTIYAATPTYDRPTQMADLTRLYQTLLHVPSLHWILCEDSNTSSPHLQDFLHNLQIPYTHLLVPMPAKYRDNDRIKVKPKGVAARNAAINWVTNNNKDGVLYFMDDDNAYDLRVFEEMRWTKRVSMWPVGLLTDLALSTPIVRHGRFLGWYDGFIVRRKFAVDMAGFATNIEYMISVGNVKMPYRAGYEEDGFLKSLGIAFEDIEFKANDCTKIYVWHTKTESHPKASRMVRHPAYDTTNIRKLQQSMVIEPLGSENINNNYEQFVNQTLTIPKYLFE